MSLTRARKIFIGVTGAVFLAVFGLSAVLTFMMAKTYASTARVDWPGLPAPTTPTPALEPQMELAQSEPLLTQVAEGLNLNRAWGKKIRVDGELKTWESVTLLKRQLEISPVEGANALEIRVVDNDSQEAAMIANRLAEIFCASPGSSAGGVRATVGVRAEAGASPVRPNIPLNLTLGAIGGLVAGLAIGGVAGWLAFLMGQKGKVATQ